MKPSVQLLAAALLLVCLCSQATAFSIRQLLQGDANPWRAYVMQQRGNVRPANGVQARDIAYIPLSDSTAKMQIYATYDSAAGAFTKVKATGDYQFCPGAEGETQCTASAACTGTFATDSPCTIYGGLGPCGVSIKGARKTGVTPAGGFSIGLDMHADEAGMCPRRRAAARRLMQPMEDIPEDEREPDQTVTYDGIDPSELAPIDDEDDENTTTTPDEPDVVPITTTPTQPITTTITPINSVDEMEPDQTVTIDDPDPSEIQQDDDEDDSPMVIDDDMEDDDDVTDTGGKGGGNGNGKSITTTNVPITPINSVDDEMDQTVTIDDPDPSEIQQDDDEDDSPMVTDDDMEDDDDVTVTGGKGGGNGNGKSKLQYFGGACEVALLIENGASSTCACFDGVTSARVGRRAARMASGNGGSNRGPVYKRWKCKGLVPKTGAACTCEA